jgi:2-polyprenyl-3-methyl-5-hydroxy-6-metoxy-1,4-benzoquinol methylase
MEFNKYIDYGAYHWKLYNKVSVYRLHIDHVMSWVRKKGTTLDIGAGDGLISYLLGAHGIDDNEIAVELAKGKGADVELCSVYDMPTDVKYDNVLMIEVIEHLEHYKKALAKVHEVLKPGGRLYVSTCPARDNGINDDLQDKYHYFEWTPKQFAENMKNAGWYLIRLDVYPELFTMYGVFKPII